MLSIKNNDIKDLINPKNFNEPISCKGLSKNHLISALRDLMLIRKVEEKLAFHKKVGEIKGPVHLGAGQEAISVGISRNLKKTDRVFGAHRSHAHLLALGSNLTKLFAEILGKSSGHSKGMGGSMHIRDAENGFMGSVPIVSGTISLAVGAALSAKMQNSGDVAVSYFGDGAVEEGVFHESLNLAKVLNCPILFVCENNLFSSHMHISKRQPLESTSRFAIANDIPHHVIDGNNFLECMEASKELINFSRENNQPTFLEAITFRKYGHVDWREDIDVGLNRSKKDIILWSRRDPIIRLKLGLINEDFISENVFEKIDGEIKNYVEEAWNTALLEPSPNIKDALQYVYSTD